MSDLQSFQAACHHELSPYQLQLVQKTTELKKLLTPFLTKEAAELEVFTSAEKHYRMRAEFRVWHEGDELYYIMFHPGTRDKYPVYEFPAAHELINQLMPAVLDYVKHKPELRNRLFQVDFLVTQTQQAVISLLYHRQLDDIWLTAAQDFRSHLQSYGHIELIGRARKQKILLNKDSVIETLTVNGRPYHFEQVENSFTQPNAQVNEKMLQWALDVTENSQGDLLELYCGNGNFSLPLAQHFNRVVGTEISRSSVQSAQTNIELNQIDNLVIARLSAEDVAAAMAGQLESRRVEQLQLNDYCFSTVFVDPPRDGIDDDTLTMLQRFDNIIYISCNPTTLADNLNKLTQTHTITRQALFDQFPFTHHIEAGVYLKKTSLL